VLTLLAGAEVEPDQFVERLPAGRHGVIRAVDNLSGSRVCGAGGVRAEHQGIGKLIMSATLVTDLGTVAALPLLFTQQTGWLVPFALASVALIVGVPRLDG
jgi:hypothetical protein